MKEIKVSINKNEYKDEPLTLGSLIKSIQKDFENNFRMTAATPDNIKSFEHALAKRIQEYKISRGNGPDGSLYYHDCDGCLFLGGLIECSMEQNNLNACYFDLYAHKKGGPARIDFSIWR